MTRPIISVIVPTRKRTALLHDMLRSLEMTASETGNHVEVILRLDYDDDETLAYLRDWRFPFIVGPRYDGYATLGRLINEAARLSHADLVLVVNDDVEFVTQDWDQKLVAEAAKYPDGLFDLGVETANAANFIFPCVSRRLIDLLGGVFDERLVYPDIALRDVLMLFGRAIRVPSVTIHHHWLGQSEDQHRAWEMAQASTYSALYRQCVAEARATILEVRR